MLLTLCLALFSLLPNGVAAKDTDLRSTLLSAGLRVDHVLYFRPVTHPEDFSDARIVLYGTSAAIKVYQPLFGAAASEDAVPFQIVFNLTGTANPDAIADASWRARSDPVITALTSVKAPAAPLDDHVCFVEIFLGIESDPTSPTASLNADLDLAHEIAHCYQFSYISTSVGGPERTWWVEGGSNWLASLVYPEQAPPANASAFDYRKDVLTGSYDNYYFWEFLGSPLGLGSAQAAVAFMRTIPEATAQHPATLEGMKAGTPAPKLFHDWARALIMGTLPYPAIIDGSTIPSVNAATMTRTTLRNARFSAGYTRISGFRVTDGNQAFIKVSDTAEHGYQVSALMGGPDSVPLPADQPVPFCPPPDGIILIHSRANGGAGDRAPFTVTWGEAPSDTPCQPTGSPSPAASCIEGEWQVTGVPSPVTLAGPVDTSAYLFSFAADGTFSGTYSIVSHTLEARYPMTGRYQIAPVPDSTTRFKALEWHTEYGAGSAVSISPAGVRTDLSQTVQDTLNSTDSFPVSFDIQCADNAMTWVVGNGYTFTLRRIGTGS